MPDWRPRSPSATCAAQTRDLCCGTMELFRRHLFCLLRPLLLAMLVIAGPMVSSGQTGSFSAATEAADAGLVSFQPCNAPEGVFNQNAAGLAGSKWRVQTLAIAFDPPKGSPNDTVGPLTEILLHGTATRPDPKPPKHIAHI